MQGLWLASVRVWIGWGLEGFGCGRVREWKGYGVEGPECVRVMVGFVIKCMPTLD